MNTPNSAEHYLAQVYSSKHEPESARSMARVIWRIIISTSLVLTCAAIGFGIWQLVLALETLSIDDNQAPTSSVTSLDQKKLRGAIEEFNTRRAHFESAKVSTSTLADPSR